MHGGRWYMRTRAPMASLSALHLSVQANVAALAHLESWCGGGPPGGTSPIPGRCYPMFTRTLERASRADTEVGRPAVPLPHPGWFYPMYTRSLQRTPSDDAG